MIRLYALDREKRDALEADLRRFYGVSRAVLSLRETAALVRHLPSEAAIFGHGWSAEAMLLADLIAAFTGESHPSDPRVKREEEKRRARLKAGAVRAAARRRRLGIAGSVLRRK